MHLRFFVAIAFIFQLRNTQWGGRDWVDQLVGGGLARFGGGEAGQLADNVFYCGGVAELFDEFLFFLDAAIGSGEDRAGEQQGFAGALVVSDGVLAGLVGADAGIGEMVGGGEYAVRDRHDHQGNHDADFEGAGSEAKDALDGGHGGQDANDQDGYYRQADAGQSQGAL